MATSSNHLAVPYSSSSSSSSSSTSWDVFLSFSGKDTRRNFTSHLYSAFDQAGIRTFRDDPALEKGEEISRGLLNAIHGSKIFIVVLSEKYASSRWCLDELVEILTCKRTSGHVVIPVFYYVDPSHLRHLKGSFKDALDVHQKRYSVDIIEKWKSALAEIAELSGYPLKTDADVNESETVQDIVKKVTPLISTQDLLLEEYLVGIDSSVEEIYEKLSMDSNDVRAIGICGMGGIGKTTTAKAFYNKYFDIFDVRAFVDDVKQHSQGGSYHKELPLLQQLSVKLFGRTDNKVTDVTSGSTRQLKEFLRTKKALIVLDDLDQSNYSDLVRVCNLVSAGSRIIFTTRDANLAKQLKEDISEVSTYMLRKLEQVDSLELFSYHAFRKPTPPESFKELSVSFITYAGGLPLALKVLGSSLLGRNDVSFWKDKLVKVQEIGENDIQQILRLSYDELGDEKLKAIFLDIAFFFVGWDKDEAVHIFQSCGFFPNAGIPILKERCLLTVDGNNNFQMHNLIQLMGEEVIREESKHGNCRRLYLRGGDACMALQNLEGIQKIEGLIIDQTNSNKRHFDAKILKRMPNLRLLEIIGALDVEGDFKNLLQELRCIRWNRCPWKHLPSSFHPQKLVSLHMPCSNLKTLWKDIKPMVNLKTINVSHSSKLKIMPDFTNLQSVEKLVFRGCRSLLQVHPSIGKLTNLSHLDLSECDHLNQLTEPIGQLTKLGHLDLGQCVNLKRLPEAIIQLTTLGSLNLGYCRNLTRLPEQLGDMKCLKMIDASCTSIEQLPGSIGHLKEMVDLKLYECKKLRKLPEQIGNMESLIFFDASQSAIEHLPDTFGGLVNLVRLHLSSCKNLTSLPNSLWKLKVLQVLGLNYCSNLEQLPGQLGKMQCLVELHACHTAIEELPDSIGLLSKLQVLNLARCDKVRNLPSSIWNLTSLAKLYLEQQDKMDKINLPNMAKDMKLKSLSCNASSWLPLIPSFSSLEELSLEVSQNFSPNESYSLSKLSNLQDLTLNYCRRCECSFPELPLNLTSLWIDNHETLEMLPDLSSLKHLKFLNLYNCTSLQELPDLSMLKELRQLRLSKCISLQSIPPLPPHLEELHLHNCTSLQSIPPLPPHLIALYLYICTSLQELPDLSMLKELRKLSLSNCINLKSSSLKQSFLQVGHHKLNSFSAHIPNKEVAEWFSYKSSGNTLSFTIPSHPGDDFFCIGLWIVYKCKYADRCGAYVRAVITNRTKDIETYHAILLLLDPVGEAQSKVEFINKEKMSMKSGDRIKVSIPSLLYSDFECQVPIGEVKVVKNCGAHVIQ